MAQAFNLTAQINLQAPSNLKTVVAQIRREFQTVSADVKVNVSPQAARSIDNVTNRLDAMNASLIQARNNTTALDSALRNLSSSLSSVQSTTSKTDNAFSKTSTSVGQTAKNIKVATTEMEEFGKQSALAIRRFAAFSVVTSGVFALINAVNSGFQAFVEFDKELVKLQQVTGRGEIGLKSLEKEISNLSTTLGVSSKSLMSVASTLAQAGLSADETRVALAALAKTELAPSFDNLTDTTEGAIAAIRQFGLEAGDLEKALGSINAVAAAFAVESKDIIAAIQRTGGVFAASSRGVSEGTDALNEFIAVFTSIRQTTRESAETIATGLRTIFTRIQRAKTIDQLKEYGVTLTDLEGKFVGPYEAVKRLSAALSQLDPRDLRFSSIVEELGGFRQIGKVIPLIQQFKTAQDALAVAQKGQGSLYDAQITAQKSLANQLAKVREQFLALIRDIGKSQSFQGLFKVVTGLASGLISLASAFKPILPILAIMGAVKGVSAIRQFGSGFMGGIAKGGGARGVGSNMGESLSGAKDKERDDTTARASDAIRDNTAALTALTTATTNLISATNQLGSVFTNGITTISRLGGASGNTLNSGGIVRKFARGGVVPGSGNGDTVPAMLEPGEFVIRKKAVATIGANNLHKINRYADGGIAKETKVGVAVLDAKNEISGSDEYTINKGDFSSYAKTTDRQTGLKYLPKGRGYTVVRETLDDKLKPLFNKAIDSGIVSGLENSLSELGSEYEIPLPLSSASAQAFLKGINDATRGNVFESMLTALSTNGNFDPDANPQAPFDYVGGFQGKLASSKLFQKIKGLNYIDAKASEEQSQAKNIAPKILLQLFKENHSGSGSDIESKISSLLQEAKPNQSFSLDQIKSSVKGTNSSVLEKLVNDGILKKEGKYYQKLASGGIAKAPLIDDILQASGSMLPKPSSAIEALIQAGGGAVDIDRTLKRTVGDKAYSKAPGSSKEAVLSKYFRDDKTRLSDITSSPLTNFGKELLEAIESQQLDAKKLSIISKSKRTQGVPEYFNELFGIPLENMVFTQGGDKQPALDAIRTKGPRTNRVRKFLGGIIQKFKLGGSVYDLQKGTGLSNPEFDSLVQFANTNDFSMDEFKTYLAKRIQEKKNKSGLMMNPASLLRAITPEAPRSTQKQLDLANMLKGEVDAKFNSKYDNSRKPFAVGGSVEDTVPALLTPGEFVINKKAAQKIGYSKLHRMNKADKIQGYNKGGSVGGIQRFAVGGEVAGVSEKTLQSILKVLVAQEKNTRTGSGQQLINVIEETIGKQASGAIDASEAIVDVAAGIRKLAIESRGSGDEDRAQSLKRVFDALDRLQQGRGGSSLRDATNTRLGLNTSKPQVSPIPASDQFSAFRSTQGGPVPDTMGPSTAWPESMMKFTSAVKIATDAAIKAAEETEYLSSRAKESGQTLAGLGKTLATKVVQQANQIMKDLPGKKDNLRTLAIGKRSSLIGANTDQIDEAAKEFANRLREIDTSAAQETIDKAAKALADGLANNDNLDKITANSKELGDILKKTYTETEATNEALKKLGEASGFTEEQMQKLTAAELKRQQFIQSESGQRFGKLAEIAPGAVQRFANTRVGGALGKAADFASGKGLVDKVSAKFGDQAGKALDGWLKTLGGPLTALGAGLAVLGDQLPKVIEAAGYGNSTTAAGVAGGIAGGGQGLASGAVLGSQIAGPIGALIGGVSGALIGAINGAVNAFQTKKLENNLKALDKASTDLETAFKKLESSSTDANRAQVQEKINANIGAVAQVAGQANLGAGGTARAITETLRGIDPTGLVNTMTGGRQEAEARDATISALSKLTVDADRLGSSELNKASTQSITDFLDKTAGMGNPADKELAMARANQGYQVMAAGGMKERDIFLSKFIAQQKQQGKTSDQISKEISDPKVREKAIQTGKELLAQEGELALKQAILSRTAKDLTIATEQLLDVYRRASAGLDKYSQELEQFEIDINSSADDLTGNAKIKPVDRTNERVLGNISAYSMDEVKAAASQTASLAGGGEAGNKLRDEIVGAKVLRDELPKALRGASNAGGVDEVLDKLGESFKLAGVNFSEALRTQLSESLTAKTDGRQQVGLSTLADDPALGSIIDDATKGREAALKFGQELQARYNDTIQKAINLQESYNDQVGNAEELQRKATSIRLNAELELANALGRAPTLSEMNEPIDTEVRSMTSGLVAGGTTDPLRIAAGMDNAKQNIKDTEDRLRNRDTSYAGMDEKGKAEAIKNDIAALGKQKKALNDGTKALEKLANDGNKAANALSKIKERQQLGDNARGLARRLLTSDSGELADFTRQMGAYTKTISGKASAQELGSLQFRQDAFAGLDNIKSVIPENIAKQMEAKAARAMIQANPQGQEILNSVIGVDSEGNAMTVDQSLQMAEEGKDPVQEQYIQAYKDATDVQAQAAQALADKALLAAQILADGSAQLMGDLKAGVEGKINQLGTVLPTAQAEAQVIPKPETKAEEPKEQLKTEEASVNTVEIPGLSTVADTNNQLKEAIIALTTAIGLLTAAIVAMKLLDKVPGLDKIPGLNKLFGGGGGGMGGTMGRQIAKTAAGGVKPNSLSQLGSGLKGGVGAFGTTGAGAVATGLVAVNTGLNAVTEGADFLSDPEAYDKAKREKTQAGLDAVRNRTNLGFAADSAAGAAEGLYKPVTKIVEGGYAVSALYQDRQDMAASQAKTNRMTEESKKGNTYGLSPGQMLQAKEEAGYRIELDKANASGDTQKAAMLTQDMKHLDKAKIDSGARTDGYLWDEDTEPYKKAVQDMIMKIKADMQAAVQKTTSEPAKTESQGGMSYDDMAKQIPLFDTSKAKTKEETKAAEQKATEEAKKEAETTKPASPENKLADPVAGSNDLLTKILVALGEIKKVIESKPSSSIATAGPSSSVSDSYSRMEARMSEAYGKLSGKSTDSITGIDNRGKPSTLRKAVKENMLAAQTQVSPQVYGSTKVEAIKIGRQEQLRNKGKLRVNEDGMPIGRSPAEEQQLKDETALRYKSRALGMALPKYKKQYDAGEMSKADYDAKVASYQDMKKTVASQIDSPTAQLYANKIDKTKKWKTLEKAHGNVESLERAQAEKLGMGYGDFLADKDKIGAFRQTEEYKSAKDKVSSARTDYLAVKDAPTVGDDFDKSGHRKNVGYEQMMASRRDSYLSRFRPEVREKMMTDKDRERYMSAASGPIPTAVPTQQMAQQTGTGPQAQQQNNNASTATAITLDPTAIEAMTSFNKTFGDYVNQLSGITIPDKVTISGNYTVDLKISGAAAIEALDKKIKEIANTLVSGTDFTSALNQLRDETSLATKNAVKSSSSRGTTSSGGSQQGQIA
jgi:hypothetical protein